MKMLHNTVEYNTQPKLEGGLQATLCSNEVLFCSPPSGFSNNQISKDDAIDYLSEVLVDTFLEYKKIYANANIKKGSNICSSIN